MKCGGVWWVSCNLFTVRVATNAQGYICEAAPIVRRFIGQPFANLERWAKTHGGYQCVDIST